MRHCHGNEPQGPGGGLSDSSASRSSLADDDNARKHPPPAPTGSFRPSYPELPVDDAPVGLSDFSSGEAALPDWVRALAPSADSRREPASVSLHPTLASTHDVFASPIAGQDSLQRSGEDNADLLGFNSSDSWSGWPSAEEASALFASLEASTVTSASMSATLRQSQPAIPLQPPPSSSGSNFFDPAFTSGLGDNLAEGMDFDWATQDVSQTAQIGPARLQQLPEHTSASFDESYESPTKSPTHLPTPRSARRLSQDSLQARRLAQHGRASPISTSVTSPTRPRPLARQSFDASHPYLSARARNEPSVRSVSGSSSSSSMRARASAMATQSSRDSLTSTRGGHAQEGSWPTTSTSWSSRRHSELPANITSHFESLGIGLDQMATVSHFGPQPGEQSFVSTDSSSFDASLGIDDSLLTPGDQALPRRLSDSAQANYYDDDTPLSSPSFDANLSLEAEGSRQSSSSHAKGKGRATETSSLSLRRRSVAASSNTSSWPRSSGLRVNTLLRPPETSSSSLLSPSSQYHGPSSAPLMQLSRSADQLRRTATSDGGSSTGSSSASVSAVISPAAPRDTQAWPSGSRRNRPISMDSLAATARGSRAGMPRINFTEVTAALDTLRTFLQQREKEAAKEEGRSSSSSRRSSSGAVAVMQHDELSSSAAARRLRHVGRQPLPPRGSVRLEGGLPPSSLSPRSESMRILTAHGNQAPQRPLSGGEDWYEQSAAPPSQPSSASSAASSARAWHRTSLPAPAHSSQRGIGREQERLDALQDLSERVKAMRRQSMQEEAVQHQQQQQQRWSGQVEEEWQEFLAATDEGQQGGKTGWQGGGGGNGGVREYR